MAENRRKKGGVDDAYLSLIQEYPLKELRSDRDLEAAQKVLAKLMLKPEEALTVGESDYLGALSVLVRAYEERRFPVSREGRTPLERLKFLMETSGMSSSSLGDVIGSRPAASMVLKGERELSKAHIRKLAGHFKLDAGYFL